MELNEEFKEESARRVDKFNPINKDFCKTRQEYFKKLRASPYNFRGGGFKFGSKLKGNFGAASFTISGRSPLRIVK